MPTCTVCGEDVELVAKCKECGAMFCDYCGDHDDKLCDFCFDEDTIDDENPEYEDEDLNQ